MNKPIWTVAAVLLIATLVLCGCRKQEQNPTDAAQAYLDDWKQQKFAAMYERLTPESKSGISGEQFAQRYRNIYDGIEAKRMNAELKPPEQAAPPGEDTDQVMYPYDMSMETVAGPVSFTHRLKLAKTKTDKETKWLIEWDPSLIFPQMKDGDKVRVQPLKAERGDIVDRNGVGLAINGTVPQAGIVPGKLGDNADAVKAQLAQKLNLSVADIDKKLNAAWVKPDLFVPLAVIPEGAAVAIRDLPGVDFQNKRMRVYPYGEAAAHLTGYIGEISAEELEKRKDKGYRTGDTIGKTGLEQIFEERLRGKSGAVIAIVDANGKEKEVLARTNAVPGATIKLTIDCDLQQTVYDQVKQDAASAAAIQPVTGDILALISSPSYDPNAFVGGMSSEQYGKWNDDPRHPFLNRFSRGYAPGSAFKIVTGAIGLDAKAITPAGEMSISGLKWTKDRSWGNYYITRVHAMDKVNLLDALVYSDNIYFAQAALRVGADTYAKEAAKFGIGEPLPIPYPFAKSQLANSGLRSDVQLADSGYGQGEVTMTSLHIALVFSALVNGGHLAYPALTIEDGADRPSRWKEQAMTAETAAILKDDLVKAVSRPDGVGHGAYLAGASIAGKTGTAELKQSKDADGQENGWFVGFNAADPKLLLSIMVEDVKGRGGSGYVTGKVKQIFRHALNK